MRRWVRQASVVVAALVVASALGACKPVPPPKAKRILVIGDSLTIGARNSKVGAPDPHTWVLNAEGGRGTDAGTEVAEAATGTYDLVIIALGTNNVLDAKAVYRARIERMMAALGERIPVIWINVDAGAWKLTSAAVGVNPALADADAAHANLRVADWNTYIAGQDPSLRASDGIHYVPAGYDVRARWMESLVPA